MTKFCLSPSWKKWKNWCLSLFLVGWCCIAQAADEPFVAPSNWGGTGLMETPTARVLREGKFRFGVAQVKPYRYYYGAISPLKGMEIDARITEILDVKANPSDPTWAGYGNYKDKAVGVKYQFIPEDKYAPAVAIGIMDPHGTRLYPSQYLVMNKQIYPFDFSLGIGNGRFGKKPLPLGGEGIEVEMFSDPGTWLSDSQLFGGIQFVPVEEFAFMVEYSPIRYHLQVSDPAQKKYFREPVSSKINYGLRWRPTTWAEIDLTYQRGEQLGVNVSLSFDLTRPFVPIYDHPYKERPYHRVDPLFERIARGLHASGFSNIVVRREDNELWIMATNDKYYFTPRAIGVMLNVLHQVLPEDIERIHLILTENNIPMVEFITHREDVALFFTERYTRDEFLHISRYDTSIKDPLEGEKKHARYADYGLKPTFRTFLNDPSGFFKYRLGIEGWVSALPWRGGSLIAGAEGYLFNTVSSANVPSAQAVRTDNVEYQQKDVVLSRLMFDQIYKMPKEFYGRLTAGILEPQYAGFDGEIAKPFFDGRLYLGISGSVVRKRDSDEPLKLKREEWKDPFTTAFFNTRLNIPEQEVSIDLKSGQFLAGDKGTRITVSKFFNGIVLSAWYSITSTSMFTDWYNRGYHDKGIAITIPLRSLKGSDSRTAYTFGISPWTRDVAQDIDHFNDLFDFLGRKTKLYLEKDKPHLN